MCECAASVYEYASKIKWRDIIQQADDDAINLCMIVIF